MAPAIDHLLRTLKRVSLVFFVSDFMMQDDSLSSRALAELGARHDLIAVIPEDPQEMHLPAGGGYVRLRDLESGKRVAVSLSGATRVAYEAARRQRRDALVRAFYRVPMDHVFVPTDRSPVLPVLSLFARRLA
jgi:hypothetical protein